MAFNPNGGQPNGGVAFNPNGAPMSQPYVDPYYWARSRNRCRLCLSSPRSQYSNRDAQPATLMNNGMQAAPQFGVNVYSVLKGA